MTDGAILPLLVEKYAELCEACYRVSVSAHDQRGRFRPRHRGRRPHPALLKKIDLDYALAEVYRRFFGPPQLPTSTSTSNSRRQGSETRTSAGGSSAASTSE